MTLQQAYLNVAAKVPTSDDIKKRLDRAYDIVRLNGSGYSVVLSVTEQGTWHVYKASTSLFADASASYTVVEGKDGHCSCPDFEKARGGLCKHRLAVMMLVEMNI